MNASALRLVRVLLVVFSVASGVGAIWTRNQGIVPGLDASTLNVFQLAFYALLVGQLAVLFVLRSVREKKNKPADRGSISIVGWAAAEGTCIFAAVIILMGGSMVPWGLGLGLLVLALVLLPAV